MSKSVTDWFASVEAYYGSLDKFPDAPTVRTMRRFALETIGEHERIMNEISKDPTDADRLDYFKVFETDLAVAKDQLEKLDMWLGNRGLTP
jgi:hypothetical protein